MARIAKTSKTAVAADAKPAKVGKVTKGDKPAKAAKSESEKVAKPRGQYAGKKISRTDAGKSMNFRGGAAVRHDHIVSFKNTDDALGSTYRIDGESEDRTITSADIAYLVERGAIELS